MNQEKPKAERYYPAEEAEKEDPKDSHVGVNLDITLTGFNGDQPIRAKIDTGAQASSLHGENIKVVSSDVEGSSYVSFSYGEFQYKMRVDSFQAITSADGGTVNRPVVCISARIHGKYIEGARFNLNDRGNMDYPVLIGLDLIKTAGLTIDPSMSEMEVSFGPNGFEKVEGSDESDAVPDAGSDSVDISSDVKDNDVYSDISLAKIMTEWLAANKHKTVQEVFAHLFLIDGPKPATDFNDPTK
jgi:hypothetical protein